MYKSNGIVRGVFKADLTDDSGKEISLSINSPKIKVLNKFTKIDENSPDSIEETAECVSLILSNNREGIQLSTDDVLDIFDVQDISQFLEDFFNWVSDIKKK